MVARADGRVDLGLHRVAHVQRAFFQRAVVAKHIGLDLERVAHRKRAEPLVITPRRPPGRRFRRRTGRVQHHHAVLTGFGAAALVPST